MDRELLLEIGCEELPAAWLPGLTAQIGDGVTRSLTEFRLQVAAPVETFSTPRRLTVRIARLAERQTDLEELVNGPPVAASFAADGQPTPAAVGFARRQGVEVAALEQVDTPKGRYLAFRRRERGRATVDVLPGVLASVLRGLSFPKLMHWDALLDDGRGDLSFGRPIRWILYLYGGRVVPFAVLRTEQAQSSLVQEVRSGAVTYGHRFLTTSGRAGRAIKVRTFDEYRARLLENFVVLERGERHDKIARELDAKARRLGGRVAGGAVAHSSLLQEVPDLVEYPAVVAGTFAPEFLNLPEEVLTTTMIHHQHFFPVVDDEGRLKSAFLSVVNTQVANEAAIARNAERVLVARLRDARFFWEADRRIRLEDRLGRLSTVLFHKALGTYRDKTERIERLARWIAVEALESPEAGDLAARAARLSKADLVTEMVRELSELQGTMGGIYAREEGLPEEIWKAIYFQYLPVSVEAAAAPSREDLGSAAVTWAAVALADKLDTLAGLFAAGERPTGSRDPFGLRRQAHGLLKILVDLPDLTDLRVRTRLNDLLEKAAEPFPQIRFGTGKSDVSAQMHLMDFLNDRLEFVFEKRGSDIRNIRAVVRDKAFTHISLWQASRMLAVLPEFVESPDFLQLATAFKRVRNIARELSDYDYDREELQGRDLSGMLEAPAEKALLDEIERREPVIDAVLIAGDDFRRAFTEAAKFGPAVGRFFDDVYVMVDNVHLRTARLRLMKRLERVVLKLADVSEVVSQTES